MKKIGLKDSSLLRFVIVNCMKSLMYKLEKKSKSSFILWPDFFHHPMMISQNRIFEALACHLYSNPNNENNTCYHILCFQWVRTNI